MEQVNEKRKLVFAASICHTLNTEAILTCEWEVERNATVNG